MAFKSVTFWCEFPDSVDWKAFQKLIDFPCSIYITARNKKEFFAKRKNVANRFIKVGAWPTLSFNRGYWFSGATSKKGIDALKDFRKIPIKIDLEPPIHFRKYSDFAIFKYGFFALFLKRYHHRHYLYHTIHKLSQDTSIIASGFPFPLWLSRRYGGNVRTYKNIRKNYFIYTTFFSQPFKWMLNFYYRYFIRKKLKNEGNHVMFTTGCVGPGIYGNEPTFKNVHEFKKDLEMFASLGVENLVVFEVAGIMKRDNPKGWIQAIKEYL